MLNALPLILVTSHWVKEMYVRDGIAPGLAFGFDEWLKAQDGAPRGQDWQTWSAALYLYAATCVTEKRTPFFDEVRNSPKEYDDVEEDQN